MKQFNTLQKEVRQRRIDSILKYEGFNKKQKAIISRFYGWLQRKGLRLESQRAYLQNLKLLLLELNKDVDKVTKKDIDKYLISIGRFKPKTQTERRKFLLLFFEWYKDKPKKDIPLIANIMIKRDKTIKLPEEILNPEEIKRLVQVADNFRDKALIILLYETAARRGEFLQLRIKHLELVEQKYGMITIPMGKTTSRKIPIIYSVPHIQNWLNSHPNRDDPDSPLFVTLGSYIGQALGDDGLKMLIKKYGERAKIKKNVYPHLLRHSRLTELGKELKEQELKVFAGWVADSGMARVYVHLSGEDVTNKMLANAGLIDQKEYQQGKDTLLGVTCPRCNQVNPADNKYCQCGFILDLKEVNKHLEANTAAQQSIAKFMNPEALKNLYKTVYKLEKKLG